MQTKGYIDQVICMYVVLSCDLDVIAFNELAWLLKGSMLDAAHTSRLSFYDLIVIYSTVLL